MILTENSVYQYEHEDKTIYERVLWFDKAQNFVIVVRLSEERGKYYLPEYRNLNEFEETISEGVIKRTVDPFERIIDPESKFYQDHVKHRDKRWERIKDIALDRPDIYDPNLRGKIIKELSDETGVSTRTYYDSLKQYWKGGQTPNALFPLYENSGAKGKRRIITEEMKLEAEQNGTPLPKRGRKSNRKIGVNVDETILKIMRKTIKKFYAKTNEPTLPEAYRYMLKNYFNDGFEDKDGVPTPKVNPNGNFPTFETFKYYVYKEQDLREIIIKRKGEKRFNLSHRAVLKSSVNDQMGPGSVFQIDATQSNVYVVNRYDRDRVLKRPTIYMIQDVFSRLIVGFYVRINAPSIMGVQLALYNAFINSKKYSSFDNEELDTCMVPQVLLPDNGSEFISINSDFLSDSSLNIRVSNASPYRADWKGIIEQKFNKLKRKIRLIPGAVNKGNKERGEKDYRVDALLDIEQLKQVIQKVVDTHNHKLRMKEYKLDEQMTKDGVQPIPIELWRWGIQNKGSDLKEVPKKTALVNLLPRDKATVKFNGIHFKKRSYTCTFAEDQQWYVKARASGSWTVPIAYDPRNAGNIYLILENGKQIEQCSLLDRDLRYDNHTIDEVEDLEEKETNQMHESEVNQLQADTDDEAFIDHMVSQVFSNREDSSLLTSSDTSKVKNINSNTKQAKDEENINEAEKNKQMLEEDTSPSDTKKEALEEKLEDFESKEQSLFRKLKNL